MLQQRWCFFFFFFLLHRNFVTRRSFCLVVIQPYKEEETCLFLLFRPNSQHQNTIAFCCYLQPNSQQNAATTSNPIHNSRTNASSTSFLVLLPLAQLTATFYCYFQHFQAFYSQLVVVMLLTCATHLCVVLCF